MYDYENENTRKIVVALERCTLHRVLSSLTVAVIFRKTFNILRK